MKLRKLGSTGIEIAPMVLGGNVFDWTADRENSFAIMDAFFEAGFNAIDTADWYNRFRPGCEGGESENMIGAWMEDRGVRDRVVIITKLGLPMGEGLEGLSRDYLPRAAEASLKRLRTDYIDIYMAHLSDPKVPIEETLEAFGKLADQGKIRHAGCSNYKVDELEEAVLASRDARAPYAVYEPHYNLADRPMFEGRQEDLCLEHGVAVLPYYSLASGFLTGKYRSEADLEGSNRVRMVTQNLNERGLDLLRAVDTVAERHDATPAQVSLAWLMARPSVTAPIASATNIAQLHELLGSADLELSSDDIALLDHWSAQP